MYVLKVIWSKLEMLVLHEQLLYVQGNTSEGLTILHKVKQGLKEYFVFLYFRRACQVFKKERPFFTIHILS